MTTENVLAAFPADTEHETAFYIASAGAGSRSRRSLKSGNTFIVVDDFGDIGAADGGPDGLFHRDTRFLSRLELTVNQLRLLLLGSSVRDDNMVYTADLTNPDIYVSEQLILPRDTLHIVRTIFIWKETVHQRLGIRNHSVRSVELNLELLFDSDFADIFEVRGMSRNRRGTIRREVNGNLVQLNYRGLDNDTRRSTLSFDPAPSRLIETKAIYRAQLGPGDVTRIHLSVGCDTSEERKISFSRALIGAHRQRRLTTADTTTVESSNRLFNEVLCRSAADLMMLLTDTPQGRYPYAGIPWYSTTFGRDGLITALQMLWFEPRVARGVLQRLAHFQATSEDASTDSQPGKILHEMREGEMAALGEVPFRLYYGTVDATPLFVLLAGAYLDRTGDIETIAELWPAIDAALSWIDRYGDEDGDGFVEYRRANEHGLINQGWKDSHDAIFHADGNLVEGDVALAEVQGYVFAAKLAAARCAQGMGLSGRAFALQEEALELQRRFEAAFWCPELETYALALDGKKNPCRVRTSNAGQVLFSGIASAERAAKVAKNLLAPESFSGWGIRTVARNEARYNPMSYHNGSIWPHDNALIALGFARYGLKSAVTRLFKGLFEATTYMELRRLPELFCGFQRKRNRGPTLYPVACSPQAWASATPFTLLEATLGLEFDLAKSEIRLQNPRLPEFVDSVLLRHVQLGSAWADLRIRRIKDEVALDIVRSNGKLQVSVVLSA